MISVFILTTLNLSNCKYLLNSVIKPSNRFRSSIKFIGENNSFIHAANPQKGVVITSLSDGYYTKNYKTAKRIL